VQFEHRIVKNVRCRDAEVSQRRSKAAQHDWLGRIAADNKAANHHILSNVDKPARADVGQGGIDRLINIVRFHQRYPGSITLPPHDRGVVSRIESMQNG